MGRQLRICVAFAPTRLSDEYLQGAYEQLVPIVEREVLGSAAERSEAQTGPDKQRPRSKRRAQ
jgi:hypothetical protein